MSEKSITAEQCRMARAGLGMKADELADAAKVSRVTLSDFEAGKRSPHPRTLEAIRIALERAGAIFRWEPKINAAGVMVREKD